MVLSPVLLQEQLRGVHVHWLKVREHPLIAPLLVPARLRRRTFKVHEAPPSPPAQQMRFDVRVRMV
jgi:hypothetical protein